MHNLKAKPAFGRHKLPSRRPGSTLLRRLYAQQDVLIPMLLTLYAVSVSLILLASGPRYVSIQDVPTLVELPPWFLTVGSAGCVVLMLIQVLPLLWRRWRDRWLARRIERELLQKAMLSPNPPLGPDGEIYVDVAGHMMRHQYSMQMRYSKWLTRYDDQLTFLWLVFFLVVFSYITTYGLYVVVHTPEAIVRLALALVQPGLAPQAVEGIIWLVYIGLLLLAVVGAVIGLWRFMFH